ncbi:MAG: hypothetical protein L0287_14850 [Anaerolineae bacterium]|nr:hypothetical protein [Anaerolineae bacterium]MCI0610478.1 hypothetical protein [Anaerolineae bacterium]
MILRDKKELLWILAVSTLIIIWGYVPTWAGYQAETSELRFRGLYYDSQDYAVHIAMMNAGMHGEWAYQFRFTTEPHNPAYTRLFYVVLGKFSGLLSINPEATFHWARSILGIIALYTLYILMRRIFQDVFWARTAFLLAALGSGMGWLQLLLNWSPGQITPIDFWFTDGYVFFSLSVFPHFAFVTAAMCIVLKLWLDYLENPNRNSIIWIVLTAILVQFANPIAFATIDAALLGAALFSWWNKRKIIGADVIGLSIIAIAQIPLLAYNVIVLSRDPFWIQFTAQNQTLSPPLIYYFWGFAFFCPPAILGVMIAFREKSGVLGACIFWIITALLLAYAPVNIQRRFLQNITIPLAILATKGLITFFEMGTTQSPSLKRWEKSLVIVFVFLASLSSIQLSLGRAVYLQTHPDDFFYPASLDHAISWLHEHAQYNDFVLAAEGTSQVLAQRAGVRVYSGHEMETMDYAAKKTKVLEFFQGRFPSLASKPIQWVIYGPIERGLAPGFQPANNLELVYDSQELQIYRVK